MAVIKDIFINDPVPSIVGNYSGILIILGCGRNVWKELEEIKALIGHKKFSIMCINDTAFQLIGDFSHAVSLHLEFLPAIKHLRPLRSLGHFFTHSAKHEEGVDHVWNIPNVGGTSSLFGCKIAILMGYEKIIMCGVPLDGAGHYYDPEFSDPQNNYNNTEQKIVWIQFRQTGTTAKGCIRSMSGRTKDVFGEPTKDWLMEA